MDQNRRLRAPSPEVLIAAASSILHLLFVTQYGWFRDELYYVVCGRHLAAGYVDHPPLIAFVARLSTFFGDHLAAARIAPIACGAATIVLTGRLARRLGGGALARGLAAFAAFVAPSYAYLFHYLSMNSLEVLLWTALVWLLLDALEANRTRTWVWVGAVAGLGLLNKYGIGLFSAALFVGIAATPARSVLRTRGPWIASLVAISLFAPHLVWQVQHGFPSLEFIRNAQAYKIAPVSPAGFLTAQLSMMSPLNAPVWIAGLVWLLRRRGAPRAFGIAYLVLSALFIVQRAKPYYLIPVYPLLIAAGAVLWERLLHRRRGLRLALGSVYLAGTLFLLPMGLPLLPARVLVPYARLLSGATPNQEKDRLTELPQHYADMFGWEELVRVVSEVHASIPQEQRPRTAIWTGSYGRAAALEVLGPGLPPVMSSHNAYWTWGPIEADTVIAVGGSERELGEVFAEVREVTRTSCRLCRPSEDGVPIYICRGWRAPAGQSWARWKRFI